jgi:phosphoserine phosphatase RsbU/P
VCGTGPAAAALTGLARHTIRASAWHGDTPTEVLTTLNRAVQRSDTGAFLTATYAVVTNDGPATHLTIATGGHPLPILVRDDVATAIGKPGTLLGVLDTLDITPTTESLQDGDVLVFYTDGATDVPTHSLNDYQWAELVAAASCTATTVEAIADNIRESLEVVLPFAQRNDDIALLILKVLDSPT